MFGFIYKKIIGEGEFLYNGQLETLKYTLDPQDARIFFNPDSKTAGFLYKRNIEAKEYRIPVIEDVDGLGLANDEFKMFVLKNVSTGTSKGKISDEIKNILIDFIQEFDVYSDGRNCFFKKKPPQDVKKQTELILMKMAICGFNRFTPVFVRGEGKKGNINKVEIGEDIEIEYDFKGVKYKTPLYGTYVARYVKAFFEHQATKIVDDDLYNELIAEGYSKQEAKNMARQLLDVRQQDFFLKFGKENYLQGARGTGKSLLISLLGELIATGEIYDRTKDKLILYYCQSKEQAEGVISYIKSAISSFGQTFFKYVESRQTLIFQTIENGKEKTLARLRFVSENSADKGLGSRPYAVICDESKEISEDIINIARAWIDTERCMFFSLTTIDYNTNKNRSYTNAVEAEFEQLNYEPVEELIVDIRTKYELDKKDKQWFLDNPDEMEEIRREFLRRRPKVCMKYTVYDSKYKVSLQGGLEALKEIMKKAEREKGKAYVLGEYFSTFVDKHRFFNIAGHIDDIKKEWKFEKVLLAVDNGGRVDSVDSDFFAAAALGLREGKIYQLESHLLEKGMGDRAKGNWIKNKLTQLNNKYLTNTELAIDISMNSSFQTVLELLGIEVQYPLNWNSSGKKSIDDIVKAYNKKSVLDVNKRQMANFTKEAIESGFVVFSTAIETPVITGSLLGGRKIMHLFDEIDNFVEIDGQLKGANRGIDDQVCAMMMGVFTLYKLSGYSDTMLEREYTQRPQFDVNNFDHLEEHRLQTLREERNKKFDHRISLMNL